MENKIEDLQAIRGKIDRVDGDLLRLLDERMKLVLRAAEIKEKNGLPIEDPKRESELLSRILESCTNPQLQEHIIVIFQDIIDASKKEQQKLLLQLYSQQNQL